MTGTCGERNGPHHLITTVCMLPFGNRELRQAVGGVLVMTGSYEGSHRLEAGLVCIVSTFDDNKRRQQEPAAMPTTTCWYRRTHHLLSLTLATARTATDDRTAGRGAIGGRVLLGLSVLLLFMRLVGYVSSLTPGESRKVGRKGAQ